MAGRGPAPKPNHLRQRANRKAGRADLTLIEAEPTSPKSNIRKIPNPDQREWHPLTLEAWNRAWESPMASQWLETDADALGRLALLWDSFYRAPAAGIMAEIRLQESRFGLSPLDRSRLQWEITRAEEGEKKRHSSPSRRPQGDDPRGILSAVTKRA